MRESVKKVTFGVIARNEQKYLPDLLSDLIKQTYDKRMIEVVLVDSKSSDDTLDIMIKFRDEHLGDFDSIKVLENPKVNQPAGWNVVLLNSESEAILRVDAHARLPRNFIEKNVICINSGEDVCGGPRENIIDENTAWKHMLLDAEQSMFGAGVALYRKETNSKKYVKSVFHGCYRNEVIQKVGLFNEMLNRTEDNEYHYRILKAGYNICYDPQIRSFYQTRNTLRAMMRQKFLNGLWIGKTVWKCPKCISFFHTVPCIFVCGIIFTFILATIGITWPFVFLWGIYGIANIIMSIASILNTSRKSLYCLILPFVFLGLHINYGVGTLIGIISR